MNRPGASTIDPKILRFGTFELDLEAEELRRGGVLVRLAPQPLRALTYLARRPRRLVRREALQLHVWGAGTFVDADLGLNACVRKIRRALGDDARSPRFVETVPRRGYRFVAPVDVLGNVASEGENPNRRGSTDQPVPTPEGPGRTHQRWLPPIAIGLTAVMTVSALMVWAMRAPTPTPHASQPALATHPVPSAATSEIPLLAVLPIEDLRSTGDDRRFLAAGLHEALMVRLGRQLPIGLGLLDHSSTAKLDPIRPLASGVAIDFVLHTSLRDTPRGPELVARLVEGMSGLVLWNDAVPALPQGAQAPQEEVAAAVATALTGELTARTRPVPSPRPRLASNSPVPEAAEARLQGLYLLLQGDPESLLRARPLFEQAIAFDPQLATAHAGLARTFNALVFARQLPPREGFNLARGAAEQALRLDPHSVDALIALGQVELYLDRDLTASERSLTRAANAAPGLARVHSALASLAAVRLDHRRAVWEARLARDLDPLGLSVTADLCWYLAYADDFAAARAECERSLELEPDHTWTLIGHSEALLGLGFEAEAAEALRLAFGIADHPEIDTVADIWARLAQQLEQSGDHRPFLAVVAETRAGNLDTAMTHLWAATRQPSFWLVYAHVDPRLDPLRSHPGFARWSAEVGLPDVVTGDHSSL